MNIKKGVFIVFCCFFSFSSAIGQGEGIDYSKISDENIGWEDGTIALADGNMLEGLLKYTSKTGILSFESGTTSKSFTARTVMSFDYFDSQLQKKRTFISVEYGDLKDRTTFERIIGERKEDTTPWKKVPQFFEILLELPTFALLSATKPIEVKTSKNVASINGIGIGTSNATYSQPEILFIFDQNGNMDPFLELTTKEYDGVIIDTNHTKRKKLDGDTLEEYTSPHFESLKNYASDNKLKFKKKEDLIKILEYYRTLIEN